MQDLISNRDEDGDSLNWCIGSSNDTECKSVSRTNLQTLVKQEDAHNQLSSRILDRIAENTSATRSTTSNSRNLKPAYAWHHEWFKSRGGWIGLALVGDYNLTPGSFGAHLLDVSLNDKRTVPFISPMYLTYEDYIVKGVKKSEWYELRRLGIMANTAILSTAECELLGSKQHMRWRCRPSPLRRSRTLIEMEKSGKRAASVEKESEVEEVQNFISQDEVSKMNSSEEEKLYERLVQQEVASQEKASKEGVSQEEILVFAFEEDWF